jgi:PAS domain S-box-containing protein
VKEALASSDNQIVELSDQQFALDQHAIVAVTDVQGTITYVNEKFCAISQYSKGELIGQNHRILNSGHHSSEFFGQMYHSIASGKVWHGEIKNRAKDGSTYWVATTIVPIAGSDGKPRHYVSMRTDITESKLAAEVLIGQAVELSQQTEELARSRQALVTHARMLQSEARYRGLLEAAPDAMVVVNPSGDIVLLNVQAEKQFGYSRDELVGQKVKSIIPQGFAERLIADGTRSAADALAQQIGTGIELVGRRKDGSEFPLEIMLSPLESTEGILVTAAIRDISARKQAEGHLAQIEERRRLGADALRESEERYRMLLDGVQTYAIFMMDAQGNVLSWNAGAERTKGYTSAQIIGHNFSCFFPPEDIKRGRPEEVLRITTASGRHEEQGMRVRKDGSRFLASIVFTALRDSAGKLRGFSEFSHDLSESKESGAKYRALLEAAPDAMVVVDQGGKIILLNVQAEKTFGYSRDELVGQQVKNIIPEGFAERLIADGTRSAAEALAQQIGTGIELIGRRKDGSEFPIEIMLSPLENAEGILVTAAIRDISARKRAEEALRRSEESYRLIVSNAKDYAMFMLDTTGSVATWNAGAERMKGFNADEIIGQNFSRFYTAEDKRDGKPAFGLEQATTHQRYEDEGWRVRKDGSRYFADVVITALRDQTGRLRGFGKIIRDITERKLGESKLLMLAERLSLATEIAKLGVWDWDVGSDTLAWDATMFEIYGFTPVAGPLPYEQWSTAVSPEDLPAAEATLRRVILEKTLGSAEFRITRTDGAARNVAAIERVVLDAQGKVVRVIGINMDITERKKAEQHLVKMVAELKRSNDELQQFAYAASHDLQEPLRMVASYTQLLAKRYHGRLDSDADEFIAFAVDGCNRMQGLIRDLLAYSRAGTNGKAFCEVSAEGALQQALTNLRITIKQSCAVVSHDSLPAIKTDETQLTQVFQNLIGNAIKYRGAEAPRVHVSASNNAGNEWIFSVRDNGLGIAPQYFERIFVLFQRLHGQNEFEGTGIGLAICKKVLERLGGRIWVESQPAKGSTFYFALPERDEK